jgi:N-acetyl-alpha-D-muramate 1-phosphate uridylyltransferase
MTYSGIGVYRREFLDGWESLIERHPEADHKPPRFKVRPLMEAALARHAVTGSHHRGTWTDVGTPERLAALNR